MPYHTEEARRSPRCSTRYAEVFTRFRSSVEGSNIVMVYIAMKWTRERVSSAVNGVI